MPNLLQSRPSPAPANLLVPVHDLDDAELALRAPYDANGRTPANVNVTQYRALARLRALAERAGTPEERRDDG